MSRPNAPLVALSCLLLAAGCNWPGKPDPAHRPVPPERVLEFTALFQRNCAGCHGAGGKLGPAPPLNDPLFRAAVPEKELGDVIKNGRKGTLMPAFLRKKGGPLSEAQVHALVYGIKGIAYRVVTGGEDGEGEIVRDANAPAPAWGEPPPAPKNMPPYLSPKRGEDSAGNRERGAKVFANACKECHGENGRGVERDGRRFKTLNDPALLSLISDRLLRRLAITGRPDLGMPNYAEKGPRGDKFKPLTSDEIDDLVALFGSWRSATK